MTTATKKREFLRLMDELRTEWFILEQNPHQPSNVNQINTLCKQMIQLNLTQQMIDEIE